MHSILASAVVIAGLSAAPLYAQTSQSKLKSETKVEVKDGKNVTLTGCVARHSGVTGYGLVDAEDRDDHGDRDASRRDIILVGDPDQLEGHVGQMVEIKGKLADSRDGKVEVKQRTKIDRENAPDAERKVHSEMKGDVDGFPVLGVKSLKVLRGSCRIGS